MSISDKINENLKCRDDRDNEDKSVIKLLSSLPKDKTYSFMEVGCGLCRFPIKLKTLYPSLSIHCLDINKDSIRIAEENGFICYNQSFLDNQLPAEGFDIVHCSHMIEHFKYPEIIRVIDELLRVTRVGGYLIIRSPLMWEKFYDDIDHVRPYPPQSIINYLYNPQQQEVGKNEVEVINIWYRNRPIELSYARKGSPIYYFHFTRKINKHWIDFYNRQMKRMWNRFRWPATKHNGYVMILRKIS